MFDLQPIKEVFNSDPHLAWISLLVGMLSLFAFIYLLTELFKKNPTPSFSIKSFISDHLQRQVRRVKESLARRKQGRMAQPAQPGTSTRAPEVPEFRRNTRPVVIMPRPVEIVAASAPRPPRIAPKPPPAPEKAPEPISAPEPVAVSFEVAPPIAPPGPPVVKEEIVETLPPAEREIPATSPLAADPVDEILFTQYRPSPYFTQRANWQYPFVAMPPDEHSIIHLPAPTDPLSLPAYATRWAEELSEHYTKLDIKTSQALIQGSAAFSISISGRLIHPGANIYIDIEIDELPLATPAGLSIEERDAFFTDRGWMVIRFSRNQVEQQPEECMAFVGRVVRSVLPGFELPLLLAHFPHPRPEAPSTGDAGTR